MIIYSKIKVSKKYLVNLYILCDIKIIKSNFFQPILFYKYAPLYFYI